MISFESLLAGKATFTVDNGQGEHYTFKIVAKQGNVTSMHFVNLLTGSDNSKSYTYMGMINTITHEGYPTKASKYTKESKPFKVLNWALRVISGYKKLPQGYSILPAGTCFKCGRKLTTPESIKSGLGPVCAQKI